ncbi:MAG: TetR/AcrR family transcriptional regulator [Polyangiaceae bacterium]|nr:TetR/AcrR family transcriptional regulator [Polyangiaceae bacterium]
MPKDTFFRLPAERRDRLVREAIREFADRTYAEASLSQIARRASIPKGSFYQYFEDKLDLYRWLLTDEVPRRKRAFLGDVDADADFWRVLETVVERGMAFLVEHPELARLAAAAADPTAIAEVRGLHRSICDAGIAEIGALLDRGQKTGALSKSLDLALSARLVNAIIGRGLTDIVLHELGAELHEVLASEALRKKLGPKRRARLAAQAVALIRGGLDSSAD